MEEQREYTQPWISCLSQSMTGVVPSQTASIAPSFNPINLDSPEAHDESNTHELVGSPESPAEDGLTASEFQIVAARANDSFLDPKQRADAAMMMLYGTSVSCVCAL